MSGLAAAFPELVGGLVRDRAGNVGEVRKMLERFAFQSALKICLAHRGVPIREDVRGPLRTLTFDERAELESWLESS